MIGIYKITSPNNRIYIGQSKNINRRFKEYKSLNNCKGQIKLYRSFLKYGILNHTFEICELCNLKFLNKKERYWQEHYNVIDEGLNCFLTKTDKKPRIISKEYKEKISNTLKKGYRNGLIPHPRKNKGKKINIYDFKGNIIHEEISFSDATKILNLSNRSVLKNTIRDERFLSHKKYVITPFNKNYYDYIYNSLKKYNGNSIPLYQIYKSGKIKRCTSSSKYRVINKVLQSDNFIYYSKKNNSYYTFIGLINAVLDRNILDD